MSAGDIFETDADKRIAELEAHAKRCEEAFDHEFATRRKREATIAELEAKLEQTEQTLLHKKSDLRDARYRHGKRIAELTELVVRMYHHCTVEKAEMTEAESDEWMTKAALEVRDE